MSSIKNCSYTDDDDEELEEFNNNDADIDNNNATDSHNNNEDNITLFIRNYRNDGDRLSSKYNYFLLLILLFI